MSAVSDRRRRGARRLAGAVLAWGLSVALGCGGERAGSTPAAPPPSRPETTAAAPARAAFAMVVHGGAGAPPRDLDPVERAAYVASLAGVLREGCRALDAGGSSLDVVEAAVRALEDDPRFNAGRGAVLTAAGTHELDASIMDGRDLSCGAVAAVRTVRSPISLARAVMERTPHVLLVGEGAEAFAREIGMEPVDNAYFTTERRTEQLRRWREEEHGTVGALALDREGHLAAATSTGGLMGKRWGRVGDSPIVGAGTYADDRTCAVSCTGTGEEFIRHGVARAISARMELAGQTVTEATEALVRGTLQPGDGGAIALSHRGEVAMVYTTGGMFRGRCGADGEVEVRIWEDAEELPAR
jgi:beta-aspartyl-peptidase (threonine type)